MHSFSRFIGAAAAAAILAAAPVFAAADESAGILPEGSVAPNIVGQSVLDGKTVPFNLKNELSKKIVVLYFFPLAFSAG
ncbi:MAG TPA: hypothetical protein VN934_12400 [Candidatus Tumulicola sp.]|nr:hypothetical protein [Candidatus Tumulicola sp.]